MSMFKAAKTTSVKLTMAVVGVAGAGKTMSSLLISRGLVGPEGRIAMISTEGGKENLYAKHIPGGFDSCVIRSPYTLEKLHEALTGATAAKYDAVIIDSLSSFWNGQGGIMEQVDEIGAMSNGGGFAGWKVVTPKIDKLLERLKDFPCHLMVCVRAKMAYEVEKEPGQKAKIKKMGLEPVWRQTAGNGIEYDMDNVLTINEDHRGFIGKTRLFGIAGKLFDKPGIEVGHLLRNILDNGNIDQNTPSEVVVDAVAEIIPQDEVEPDVSEKQKLLTKLEDLAIKTKRDTNTWFPQLAKHFGKEDITAVANTKLKEVILKVTKDLEAKG